MAKSSTKSGGTSRIRFIMVDAELSDGDIGQVTQAISNALRGSTGNSAQRVVTSTGPKAVMQEQPETEVDSQPEEELDSVDLAKPVRPKGQRKPAPTPEVLDLDLTSEPSLESYAKRANPESDRKRFLVIAAWFKEHRQIDAVTAAHIYTAYRKLKWPTNIPDFSQPLRNLKHNKLFTSPERGSFAINHLGLSEVEAMMSGNE